MTPARPLRPLPPPLPGAQPVAVRCPRCKGTGTIGGTTSFHYDYPTPCTRCDGTGMERRP